VTGQKRGECHRSMSLNLAHEKRGNEKKYENLITSQARRHKGGVKQDMTTGEAILLCQLEGQSVGTDFLAGKKAHLGEKKRVNHRH